MLLAPSPDPLLMDGGTCLDQEVRVVLNRRAEGQAIRGTCSEKRGWPQSLWEECPDSRECTGVREEQRA